MNWSAGLTPPAALLVNTRRTHVGRQMGTPLDVVRAAAADMRRKHYVGLGAKPLQWDQLTDAQKIPWIMAAICTAGTARAVIRS